MAIGKQELTRIIDRTLNVLEREKVLSLKDLAENVGKEYELEEVEGESIKITLEPSQMNTKAYRISYIMPDSTVPLEIRINPEFKYTRFVLRVQEQIFGFNPYTDSEGRQCQNKFLNKITNISKVRDALGDVATMCEI